MVISLTTVTQLQDFNLNCELSNKGGSGYGCHDLKNVESRTKQFVIEL